MCDLADYKANKENEMHLYEMKKYFESVDG